MVSEWCAASNFENCVKSELFFFFALHCYLVHLQVPELVSISDGFCLFFPGKKTLLNATVSLFLISGFTWKRGEPCATVNVYLRVHTKHQSNTNLHPS